ncbi:MAG: hypothetical protein R3B96_04820 [Pirellulaceae bacterium]
MPEAFYILDTQKTAIPNFYPVRTRLLHPHRALRSFPELFDVPLGDEEETRMKYDQAWAFATGNGDWAWNPITDEEFPGRFALIAAKRGDHQTATRILAWYQADMTGKRPLYPRDGDGTAGLGIAENDSRPSGSLRAFAGIRRAGSDGNRPRIR